MTDLDWNLIRSFVGVAEAGSLSAAARKLAASQPTLGRHIAELEQALGVVLFRRGRTGYELTEQGAALFDRAQTVGEAANAFARLATGATEQVAGTVRVAASEVVSAYVLPPMVARLRQAGAGESRSRSSPRTRSRTCCGGMPISPCGWSRRPSRT